MPRLGANQRAVLEALYPSREHTALEIAEEHPDWNPFPFLTDAITLSAVNMALCILVESEAISMRGGNQMRYRLTPAGRDLAETHGIGAPAKDGGE